MVPQPTTHAKKQNQEEEELPKEYWHKGYHHYEEGTVASELQHYHEQEPEEQQHAHHKTAHHSHRHMRHAHLKAGTEGEGQHHYVEATISTDLYMTASEQQGPSDLRCHMPDGQDHARFVHDKEESERRASLAIAGDGSAHFYGHSHHSDHHAYHKIMPGQSQHYEMPTVSYELHSEGHAFYKSEVKPYEELGSIHWLQVTLGKEAQKHIGMPLIMIITRRWFICTQWVQRCQMTLSA